MTNGPGDAEVDALRKRMRDMGQKSREMRERAPGEATRPPEVEQRQGGFVSDRQRERARR